VAIRYQNSGMLKQVDVKRRLTLLTTNMDYSKLLCFF